MNGVADPMGDTPPNAGSAARNAIMALLEQRGAGKTICPSEAARLLAADADHWRDCMPEVHEAARILHREDVIQLSWRGELLAPGDGPYRIGTAT